MTLINSRPCEFSREGFHKTLRCQLLFAFFKIESLQSSLCNLLRKYCCQHLLLLLNFNGRFLFLFQQTPAFWEEEEVSDHLLFLATPSLLPELSKQLALQLLQPHIGTSVFLCGILMVYGRV